jgi:hypothetical protein
MEGPLDTRAIESVRGIASESRSPSGWMKSAASLRRFLHRGLDKVTGVFKLSAAAFNLVRMAKLTAPA